MGVLCALFAGVFRYVDQHFHNEETFLENTASLADDADVRVRLFEGFREEIIQIADGDLEEEEESGSLADFLDEEDDDEVDDTTDPVTAERNARDEAIEGVLLDVFESDLYDTEFRRQLIRVRQQIVRTAEIEEEALLRDKGEITFNMQRLYEQIWPRLAADERTVDITTNGVPEDYGIVSIGNRDTTLDVLWSAVDNGPKRWKGLTLLSILSLAGALILAERRPSRAIQFGGGMVGFGVVTVVLIFLIRFIVPLLASGGSTGSTNAVVATYVANTWPLIRVMIRLIIMGAILAGIGGIARLIWPDDWVYSSVSDDRGVRSVMRRRGAPQAAPQEPARQQVPAAAAVPVGYQQGYPQQYPGQYPQQQYPQPWGQPYPGQYPPGYGAPYPVGPYAQPSPQHYQGPGQPTVPVQQVHLDGHAQVSGELAAVDKPVANPVVETVSDALPADAAQAVPKVVADLPTPDPAPAPAPTVSDFSDIVVPTADSAKPQADAKFDPDVTQDVDDWAAEQDW